MNMFDLINAAQGGNGLGNLAKQFGLDQSQTQAAVQALLPALSSGMKRNSAEPDGLASLLGALQSGKHIAFDDDSKALAASDAPLQGNGILGHILGSKDVSRAVAEQASQQSGIGQSILKQMLPIIASMVMGSLAKQIGGVQTPAPQPTGGFLGSILKQVLSGALGQNKTAAQPSASDIFGSMLDADGDGSAMDDILGMAKKFMR